MEEFVPRFGDFAGKINEDRGAFADYVMWLGQKFGEEPLWRAIADYGLADRFAGMLYAGAVSTEDLRDFARNVVGERLGLPENDMDDVSGEVDDAAMDLERLCREAGVAVTGEGFDISGAEGAGRYVSEGLGMDMSQRMLMSAEKDGLLTAEDARSEAVRKIADEVADLYDRLDYEEKSGMGEFYYRTFLRKLKKINW